MVSSDLELDMAQRAAVVAMLQRRFHAENGLDEVEHGASVADDEIGREAIVVGGLVHDGVSGCRSNESGPR
jgi:hypothetical protein